MTVGEERTHNEEFEAKGTEIRGRQVGGVDGYYILVARLAEGSLLTKGGRRSLVDESQSRAKPSGGGRVGGVEGPW